MWMILDERFCSGSMSGSPVSASRRRVSPHRDDDG